MIKCEELATPDSCWNKAADDEMVYVILERDAAMPAALEAWIAKRIELGLNKEEDQKIQETRAIIELVRRRHVR